MSALRFVIALVVAFVVAIAQFTRSGAACVFLSFSFFRQSASLRKSYSDISNGLTTSIRLRGLPAVIRELSETILDSTSLSSSLLSIDIFQKSGSSSSPANSSSYNGGVNLPGGKQMPQTHNRRDRARDGNRELYGWHFRLVLDLYVASRMVILR